MFYTGSSIWSLAQEGLCCWGVLTYIKRRLQYFNELVSFCCMFKMKLFFFSDVGVEMKFFFLSDVGVEGGIFLEHNFVFSICFIAIFSSASCVLITNFVY